MSITETRAVRGDRHRLLGAAAFMLGLTINGCAVTHDSTTGGSAARRTARTHAVAGAQGATPGHGGAVQATSAVGVKTSVPSPAFVTASVEAVEPPPSVNQFGEFDGYPRTSARAGGEAAFQQHTYLSEGFDGDVATDPSGKWLVFSSTRHSERAQIYLQRADGISVVQLTSDDSSNAFPVFSPDGRHIAFSSTRAGNWDVYVMDVDGKNVMQVTSGPAQDLHPSFSPDGSRLAYSSVGTRSGQWELWVANLATSERRMIGFGLFPSWSPDASVDRIAFQRARQRGSRWFSLWTLDLVNGEARNVTEVAVSANAAIVSPSWSPDGKRLAFSTIVEPARTNGRGTPVGQQDVWTVNADGSNRHRLTDGNGTNATPFWGADNRVYFVSDRAGTECVWSVQAESGTMPFARRSNPAGGTKSPAVGSTEAGEVGR